MPTTNKKKPLPTSSQPETAKPRVRTWKYRGPDCRCVIPGHTRIFDPRIFSDTEREAFLLVAPPSCREWWEEK